MSKPWFNPKRFGYGAGLPCSWQGWLLLLGYMALSVTIGVTLIDTRPALGAGALALITVLLLIVCARTTRGGWRWRWGQD